MQTGPVTKKGQLFAPNGRCQRGKAAAHAVRRGEGVGPGVWAALRDTGYAWGAAGRAVPRGQRGAPEGTRTAGGAALKRS
jgi:hypothetical protein